MTDWTNDVFAAEWLQGNASALLTGWGVADWLTGLVADGIIAGVGAVLGFVPPDAGAVLMLSLLEDVGYMAHRLHSGPGVPKFGLSGKALFPAHRLRLRRARRHSVPHH